MPKHFTNHSPKLELDAGKTLFGLLLGMSYVMENLVVDEPVNLEAPTRIDNQPNNHWMPE